MAGRTNTEKIEATAAEVVRQGNLLVRLDERYGAEVGTLMSDVRRLNEKAHELDIKMTSMDQRLLHVEQLLDEGRTRRWQVWLAFLGAAMSATVALVIAFVKR